MGEATFSLSNLCSKYIILDMFSCSRVRLWHACNQGRHTLLINLNTVSFKTKEVSYQFAPSEVKLLRATNLMCLECRFDMVEAKRIGTNSRRDDMLIIGFWDVRGVWFTRFCSINDTNKLTSVEKLLKENIVDYTFAILLAGR